MTPLRWTKLLVMVGVPLLGLIYAYQFTGQAREVVVPFRSFGAPPTPVFGPGARDQEISVDWKAGSEFGRSPVTVVNFWATWCPPCVEEFPAMLELQRLLEPNGVRILFISLDERWEDVERFQAEHNIQVQEGNLLWDPERTAATLWGSERFPETYVVRPDGWVVERIVGAQAWTRPVVVRYFEELAEKFASLAGWAE